MTEKEQLIANLNDSEEIISQISAKETEIENAEAKLASFRKSTGGNDFFSRILWFLFVYCCLLYGMLAVICMMIAKIWSPLGILCFLAAVAYGFYFYFIYPIKLKNRRKSALQELEELRKSPKLS